MNKNHIDCCICLDTIKNNIATLSCGHIMHKKCLTRLEDANYVKCPLCRQKFTNKKNNISNYIHTPIYDNHIIINNFDYRHVLLSLCTIFYALIFIFIPVIFSIYGLIELINYADNDIKIIIINDNNFCFVNSISLMSPILFFIKQYIIFASNNDLLLFIVLAIMIYQSYAIYNISSCEKYYNAILMSYYYISNILDVFTTLTAIIVILSQ